MKSRRWSAAPSFHIWQIGTILRRQHAARYAELLADTPVKMMVERPECRSVYHLFVVRKLPR